MQTFNNNLKELRKAKELTQLELAKLLDTTDDSIYSWEKGRSEPDINTLIKICKIFKVSADYLIGIEDECGVKIYEKNNSLKNVNVKNSFNNSNNSGTFNF